MIAEAPEPWEGVTAARLPSAGLVHLGAVRDRPGVRVHLLGDVAWVTWPGGMPDVIACLLPAAGVEFLVRRGDEWFRFNSRVPTSDQPPSEGGQPLDAVLVPGRIEARPPHATPLLKLPLRIARGGATQPTTGLRCSLGDLLHWVEVATTLEVTAVTAARNTETVLLRGGNLPVIPGATRYWGTDVLFPLGFRPEPDLGADVLRAVVGASTGDVVLFGESGVTVIPGSVFAPLTRAGVRLAAGAGASR